MDKFLTIKEASDLLGVSTSTLRRWEREGRLIPDDRTEGNQRRYLLSSISPEMVRVDDSKKKTIAYARVSSHDQKEDLERQKKMLELFCSTQGWQYEIVADLGSGMNYRKKGLKKLLEEILEGDVGRLVITHKDRLLRFGAELVFAICEAKNVEVLILNKGEDTSFEEDLAKDVLEIITVFSARLYGSRSHKNKKIIENMKKAVENADCP
jgi:putative resolvase